MKRAILCMAIVLVVYPVAAAQSSGRADCVFTVKPSDPKIEIKSGRFLPTRDDLKAVEFTFSKAVRLKQGDLTLTCDKLVIVYGEKIGKSKAGSGRSKVPTALESLSGSRSMIASGNVRIRQGERIATSDKAIYDPKRGIWILNDPLPRGGW